jgi:hypothetical protein
MSTQNNTGNFSEWKQWPVNGHYYKAVSVPNGISWENAKIAAINEGGYLVTITSKEENDFVFSLISDPNFWSPRMPITDKYFGPWLGGYQSKGSKEPDGGWVWVTGEAFSYTNWCQGEPNNELGREKYLHFFCYTAGSQGAKVGTWNDEKINKKLPAYIIELD